MFLSSMFTWFREPTAVPMWDRHSGSRCAVTHSGGGTPGCAGMSLWIFPRRKPTKRREKKKELPILLPKGIFKNVTWKNSQFSHV